MGAVLTKTQTSFRIRNDDGTEVTATWKGAVNSNAVIVPLNTFRLRFLITLTGGIDVAFIAQLEYNLNGLGWNDVNTTSDVVKAVNSPNVTNGTPTTQQIGSGTFTPSEISTDGATASVVLAIGETEPEFVIQMVGAIRSPSTIQLRVKGLNAYTQTPSMTVVNDELLLLGV